MHRLSDEGRDRFARNIPSTGPIHCKLDGYRSDFRPIGLDWTGYGYAHVSCAYFAFVIHVCIMWSEFGWKRNATWIDLDGKYN